MNTYKIYIDKICKWFKGFPDLLKLVAKIQVKNPDLVSEILGSWCTTDATLILIIMLLSNESIVQKEGHVKQWLLFNAQGVSQQLSISTLKHGAKNMER